MVTAICGGEREELGSEVRNEVGGRSTTLAVEVTQKRWLAVKTVLPEMEIGSYGKRGWKWYGEREGERGFVKKERNRREKVLLFGGAESKGIVSQRWVLPGGRSQVSSISDETGSFVYQVIRGGGARWAGLFPPMTTADRATEHTDQVGPVEGRGTALEGGAETGKEPPPTEGRKYCVAGHEYLVLVPHATLALPCRPRWRLPFSPLFTIAFSVASSCFDVSTMAGEWHSPPTTPKRRQ